MVNCLIVGIGGLIGSICRYLIGLIPVKESMVFPVKTLCINIIGCLAIGLAAVMVSKNPSVNPKVILLLKVGVCGGFTTFSTFALETVDLMNQGYRGMAFLYLLLSVVLGVAIIFGVQFIADR